MEQHKEFSCYVCVDGQDCLLAEKQFHATNQSNSLTFLLQVIIERVNNFTVAVLAVISAQTDWRSQSSL